MLLIRGHRAREVVFSSKASVLLLYTMTPKEKKNPSQMEQATCYAHLFL